MQLDCAKFLELETLVTVNTNSPSKTSMLLIIPFYTLMSCHLWCPKIIHTCPNKCHLNAYVYQQTRYISVVFPKNLPRAWHQLFGYKKNGQNLHFFERLWKPSFVSLVTALAYNHQHSNMFQHPPLHCEHLILARFLCWNWSNNYMYSWVILIT